MYQFRDTSPNWPNHLQTPRMVGFPKTHQCCTGGFASQYRSYGRLPLPQLPERRRYPILRWARVWRIRQLTLQRPDTILTMHREKFLDAPLSFVETTANGRCFGYPVHRQRFNHRSQQHAHEFPQAAYWKAGDVNHRFSKRNRPTPA